jgi:hypothetical protein
MPDLHHLDDPLFVIDGADDPVVSLTNPVAIMPREFLAAGRPRVVSQAADSLRDTAEVTLRDRSEFVLGRALQDDATGARHA